MYNCIHCNTLFERASKRHPKQRYCSSKCIKAAYVLNNPDKNKKSKDNWIKNNPEKRKEASESYRKNNKAYYTQYASLRSRRQMQAKIKSLTELDELVLVEYYDLAKRLGLEVDHIIPLQNKRICGLHVPWNLQMLTRSANAQKNNKFSDEDVVAVIKDA